MCNKILRRGLSNRRPALGAASNYADSLCSLQRFKEGKALHRKTIPVARRALGEDHQLTLRMRGSHAEALYMDAGTTFDDLREAATTFEEMERTARRVFGSAHPLVTNIEAGLREASMAFCVASMALRGA